jgi:molybdate transport system ATP-binding protein
MASELSVDARVEGEGHVRVDARFTVPPGVTVLYGPSGSGKSTCLAAIAGLVTLARGRIALGDEVLSDTAAGVHRPVHLRRVGMVFQSLALFPHLSVTQNVAYGLPRGTAPAKAQQWLERMKVGTLSARSPSTLSGGEAQRVALARALASEPRALLLDEPFSALDVTLRRELGAELKTLIAELKIPTLLVTHDRDDARALGERVVLLDVGKVVGEGPPATALP